MRLVKLVVAGHRVSQNSFVVRGDKVAGTVGVFAGKFGSDFVCHL